MKASRHPPLLHPARLFTTSGAALCALLWLAGPSHRLGAGEPPAGDQALPPLSFVLRDQFNREYTEAYCRGKTSILMVYDGESGQFGAPWGREIRQAVDAARVPPPQWINVTLLPSVPSFLRRIAGRYLPKDPAQWTLLDWEKQFAKTYRIPAKHLGILVCGADARVRLCASVRDVDPAVVASIVAALAGPNEAAGTASREATVAGRSPPASRAKP